jgi:hypothetical protein
MNNVIDAPARNGKSLGDRNREEASRQEAIEPTLTRRGELGISSRTHPVATYVKLRHRRRTSPPGRNL